METDVTPRASVGGARRIGVPLIGGSAIFGVGWGIAGVYPGGALPALGTPHPEVLIFITAAAIGILAACLGPTLAARVLRPAPTQGDLQ